MKAVVFHDNYDIRFETVSDPQILHPGDALVQVSAASICGSDIHIKRRGREMQVTPGTILGHEFVGVVAEAGAGVAGFSPGDRVAVSCIFSCGQCYYCRKGLASQCPQGACFGAMGDGTNHGAHAAYIRIPYAARTMRKIPETLSDEEMLFVGDILSTGLFGVDQGGVTEGDAVVVFGAGPVGMCAMMAARLRGASKVIAVEKNPARIAVITKHRLADEIIFAGEEKPAKIIRALTEGRGADVVIDAVGGGSTFGAIFASVRPGGVVSLLGVYNDAVQFHIYRYWWKNITVKMGLVETGKMDSLIEWIRDGKLNALFMITHVLPFPEIMKGYEVMEKQNEGVLKVAIKF